ncbi:armadillo-type protein [Mycena vulgaris]|nr:armadillo-type protein [Mycena vulgaris]
MNSLTGQRTPESVRSWWSDNNPTGPNSNLHALAKPLMKLMYHRQALDYIAEHDGKPLSRDDMEIYASYLEFKHVSSATKTAVLRELTARVNSQNDHDARTMVDFLSLHPPTPSSNHAIPTSASVCKQLVSLLQDEDFNVRMEALSALGLITSHPEGALAAIDAHVLDGVAELLESPITAIREQSFELLVAMASHKATAPGVLGANICEQLVTLLRDENLRVIESAIRALYWITKSPEGMQAAIDANLLDHVTELLESRGWHTRNFMCSMLAAHDGMLAKERALIRYLSSESGATTRNAYIGKKNVTRYKTCTRVGIQILTGFVLCLGSMTLQILPHGESLSYPRMHPGSMDDFATIEVPMLTALWADSPSSNSARLWASNVRRVRVCIPPFLAP